MSNLPDTYAQLPQRRTSLRPSLQAEGPFPAWASPPPAAASADEGSLEVARKLWRRRRLIAVCTLAMGGLGVLAVWSVPSRFVAEARVQVGVQTPRVLNAETIIAELAPDAARVETESFTVRSRTLAQTVVDRLNLAADPEFNPELRKPSASSRIIGNIADFASRTFSSLNDLFGDSRQPAQAAAVPASQRADRMVDQLLDRVDVSLMGRSHVLSIKAEAQSGVTAAAIANELARAFLEHQRQEKIASLDRADKFLLGRIGELREQVRKSDQAVEDYRRSHGLYKSSNTSVTAQQLTELNSQLLTAQTAKAEAEAKLHEAQELRKGGLGNESVPEVLRSPLIAALKQQQAESERKAAEISATYGARHPLMANARAEAGSIQARVGAEIAKTVDGLAREARTADARYQALRQNFEELKSKMGQVNDESIGLDALERDATVNRNLLEAMLNRAKQSSGAGDILQADAKLVSPAAPPEAASYPPKTLLVSLALFGGLLLGSALALMREGADRTFRRADQIEAITGLPVISMVPQVARRARPAMQVLQEPTSPYSEALRRLQVGITLSSGEAVPKTLLFSSATPSEGKSAMVASFGRLLAGSGKRVLLIDCDWRSPRLHQLFRCSNRDGLASLLGDEVPLLEDIIQHDEMSSVEILPAGNWSPRAADTLTSDRMKLLLEALAPHYDFILLDTAPALVAADALALSRLVDKVVFLVRWGHTRQEAVVEALKQIVEVQGDIAGVVMSRVVSKQYRKYGYSDPFAEYSRSTKAAYH